MDNENSLECLFCERIQRGDFDEEREGCVVFSPKDPVTLGHVVVAPRTHIRDVTEQPHLSAALMYFACELVKRLAVEEWEQPNAHILANIGPLARQTVWHAHLHVIPRHHEDGLPVPLFAQGGA